MRSGSSTAVKIMTNVFFNLSKPQAMQQPTLGHRGDSVNVSTRPRALCYVLGAAPQPPMETLTYTILSSPVGPLFLATSGRGLVALEFDTRLPGQQSIRPNPRDLRSESKSVRFEPSDEGLEPYVAELQQYFAGARRRFDFPLDLRGTDFQLACWRALLAIPYGETRSYADI